MTFEFEYQLMPDAEPPPLVLIVEDDALIRMAAVFMVEDAGFGTLEAASADEALDILASRNDIRIVFTDIQMPGSMDGLQLVSIVRNQWPEIDFIVTSGRVSLGPASLPPPSIFLSKPYTLGDLRGALQSFEVG